MARGMWIDFGKLLGKAFVLGIAVGLVLTLAAAALPAPLQEEEPAESPRLATSGRFLMRRASGEALDDGAEPRHRGELPRRGGRGARDGAPALPERDRRLGRGRLRLPAARERRRRPPADEGRRARDRGADPRARAGEGGVPAGEERGEEGEPRRAGAAQPVHDQRRQPGPGRDAGGRDRVPADALVRRGRGAAALPARGGAALHPGPGDGREALRPRLGARHRPRPRRVADHAAARAGGRAAPQPGLDRGRARPRLSAAVARQPLPRDRQPADGRRPLPREAPRGAGAGRSRLRARLDAEARSDAARRPLPRGARRRDLRAPHALSSCRPGGRGHAAAARDRVRDRHLGIDGGALDPAGAQGAGTRRRTARARGPLQRDPVQQRHAGALERHPPGHAREPQRGAPLGRTARGARRDRDGGRARGGARGQRRPAARAPGRVPDRRQRRQRGPALRHHQGAARRHAALHGRHRLGARTATS